MILNCSPPQAVPLEEHVRALRAAGQLAFSASSRSFWLGAEMRSLLLFPPFPLEVPTLSEVRKALWRARSPVATYVCPPDTDHPPNAWLYVCEDQNYHLGRLKHAERSNVRRAEKMLRFEFLDDEALRQHGANAFRDTHARAGLSDSTLPAFQRMVAAYTVCPGRATLGAWAGDQLAGYILATLVDDWVEVFPYSTNEHLSARPVNGLVHNLFEHFLVERKFRVVSFGLSSIQEESNAVGLHCFKKRIGCECRPVHRAVAFHPLLAPLANSASLWGLRRIRKLWPGHPAIRKATGILAAHLGANPMPHEAPEPSEA